ncbi:MAG: decarboxylase [Candidatus Thiodiazotropha sp. DIVDIV]
MPFFIFKISPDQTLEYLDEMEKYQSAREKVRSLRASHQEDDGSTYRMVFAKSVGQGEILLTPSNTNEEQIIGDD